MNAPSLLSIHQAGSLEVGCDEAGRGCLAGPVFAAAVMFPEGYKNELINDSKKLSEGKRMKLKELIERDASAFAVAQVSIATIEKINILQAAILAMHKALDSIQSQGVAFNHIIVDGNKFKPYQDVPHQTIVKGDGKYLSIAAASILAKTYRDAYMNQIAAEYPQYHWLQNKGYGTKIHRAALLEHGTSEHHRPSFLKKILTQ